jgi:hypothetical protein
MSEDNTLLALRTARAMYASKGLTPTDEELANTAADILMIPFAFDRPTPLMDMIRRQRGESR